MFIHSSTLTFKIIFYEDGEILYKFNCTYPKTTCFSGHSWFSKIAWDLTMVKFYSYCDESVVSQGGLEDGAIGDFADPLLRYRKY